MRGLSFGKVLILAVVMMMGVLKSVSYSEAAGAVQLPRTGQEKCYNTEVPACTNTGQDGDIKAGVAWPSKRFIDNNDGTITDDLTGLMWTQDANAPGDSTCNPNISKIWQGALEHVKCLNTNKYKGYSDWRIPNVIELESLVNAGYMEDDESPNSSNADWLINQGFNKVQAGWYWTSTNSISSKTSAYVINMIKGDVFYYNKTNGFYVWPVRGVSNSSSRTWKTGQVKCYNTSGTEINCADTGQGQDGDIKEGVDWPIPRFVNNADGTITDKLTGLSWSQNAKSPGTGQCIPGVTKSWQDALKHLNCLNTNKHLGYGDWRLPNRKELLSLLNYGESTTAMWLNKIGFSEVQTSDYWSSTSNTADTTLAWIINLSSQKVSVGKKTTKYYIWPVRGGGLFANLKVIKKGAGSGTVTSSPEGILCGIACEKAYEYENVTLTASPASSSTFKGWSGDCSLCATSTLCIINMNADKSCTAEFELKLSKPSNLAANAISATSIVLSWKDNSDNEDGFRIQRRLGDCSLTNANIWSSLATKGANVTSHTNSGLLPDTMYSYRIRAYNPAGNSAWSNCATATTAKSGTPNAPSGLNATATTANSINLKLTDKSTDETSFKIWRKASANAWALLTTINTSNTTKYSDTTAAGNAGTTTYSYYVKACNSSGCSPATTTAGVPYKPTALTATAGTGKVDLAWTDKSTNETGFQLQRKAYDCSTNSPWSTVHTTGTNAISYSDTSLQPETYSYRVRSFTKSSAAPYAYGYSRWSNCVTATAL